MKNRFQFRTLRSRIIVLVLAVLLLVQLASFVAIRSSIATNVRSVVSEELLLGERVLNRLLEQNAASLRQGTEVLAADFGFRAAVASQDRATIESALHNHGARVGAGLMGIYARSGELVTTVGEHGNSGIAWRDLPIALTADRAVGGSGLVAIDGRLMQVVLLPVRAPVLIGWLLAGFDVGDSVARELRQLTAVDVSFVRSGAVGADSVLASSLGDSSGARVIAARSAAAPGRRTPFESRFNETEFSSLWVPLGASTAQIAQVQPVTALMQRSISDAAQAYDRLQFVLLVLTVLGMLISAILSFATAHNIARPVRALANLARGLGAGQLDEHISTDRRDELGELAGAFNTMSDQINEREATIRRLAFEDSLTGLPNRARVMEELSAQITSGKTQALAVLSLGLSRFKQVNAVLGLSAGDCILREVAGRLDAICVSHGLRLARMAGDTFVCVLELQDPQTAVLLATELHAALREPIMLDLTTVDLSAAIGLARWPEHGDTPERLLAHAEIAMRSAKRGHEDTREFSDSLDVASAGSLSMASDLRRAIRDNELVLYYQPKYQIDTGKVLAAEALVRWQHPVRGFIAPGEFIPFAESSGLVTEISAWALRMAVRQIAQWNASGRRLAVSVNLSTRDLLNHQLPDQIGRLIADYGVLPSQLCLEITESTIMEDAERALATLDRLSGIGVKLSIDDFGTGYSSLSYLQRMPVDELKIDREFVRELDDPDQHGTIVRSTIDLGHNLGLSVVAEGIETELALERLRGFGCDLAQGYLIARPMDPLSFAAWHDQHRPVAEPADAVIAKASQPSAVQS